MKTLSPATLQSLADLFKHLSDPHRLQLLRLLSVKERSVGDLAQQLRVTLSAVSHQLRSLRAARLVDRRRSGQKIFYHLADDHVFQLVKLGEAHVKE